MSVMSDKDNNIRYVIASRGSSLSSSPPPTRPINRLRFYPAEATTTASISGTNERLHLMAVSEPSSALAVSKAARALLTTNPTIFIKDAFTTSVETWSPCRRAWILPEAFQCPVLKFALREGRVIVFASGRITKVIDKGSISKVPSYALVWPAHSVESWACDARRARLVGGYLEVSFAMKFLDAPQLIAFGGGNALPVVLRPQQLSARFDYLCRLVSHVQTELKGSSATWLRFASCRPVHPASRTLAERDALPRMLSLSTDVFAFAGAPVPAPAPALMPGTAITSQEYDMKVRHIGGDGANDIPIDSGSSVAQRRQNGTILVDLLEPVSESTSKLTPHSRMNPLAPSTLADLFDVQLGPSSLPSLPPLPPLTPYTEGFIDEPITLGTLNGAVSSSVTICEQAYCEALKKKQEYLEKLWLECTEEIERMKLI
ncbi:hypothetical protein TWF506_010923 [Arthrobotrys conoides]|uniref:Uncharacterized protein n=1 Tax=Arthrobotrys conoides TaxID=74498 RepID=A0AAN8RMP4_9PEZI